MPTSAPRRTCDAVSTAPERTAATLSIVDLCVPRGGREVLHDVSIDIVPGEVTALLGPNGAGKSTLVLTVAGAIKPTSGTVKLGDEDLTKRRPEKIRQAGVAVVPEGRRLLPASDRRRQPARRDVRARRPMTRASGVEYALELFPELRERWDAPGSLAVGWPAADGRARPGARLAPDRAARRRALARPGAAGGEASRADARGGRASPASRCCSSSSSPTSRSGSPTRRTSSRAGASATTAPRKELKENPERLHSAYLLRT